MLNENSSCDRETHYKMRPHLGSWWLPPSQERCGHPAAETGVPLLGPQCGPRRHVEITTEAEQHTVCESSSPSFPAAGEPLFPEGLWLAPSVPPLYPGASGFCVPVEQRANNGSIPQISLGPHPNPTLPPSTQPREWIQGAGALLFPSKKLEATSQ